MLITQMTSDLLSPAQLMLSGVSNLAQALGAFAHPLGAQMLAILLGITIVWKWLTAVH